ncbi:MAG: hypothetical protein ACI9OU_000744 [Candidatus Promineifilaceae bacterium]
MQVPAPTSAEGSSPTSGLDLPLANARQDQAQDSVRFAHCGPAGGLSPSGRLETFPAEEFIAAIATVDQSGGQWSIALPTRHPSKHADCTVTMKDAILDGSYNATVLSGDATDAYNHIAHPNRVVPQEVHLIFKKCGTAFADACYRFGGELSFATRERMDNDAT